jgi:hypothetical protein
MSADDEINAVIDELSVTTLYSRDALTRLACEYPDAGFIRWVVNVYASGLGFLGPDFLWQMYQTPPAESSDIGS